MTPHVDVVVAGGGPAGLAAAIHAARAGMSVAVFDPRPDPVDKACGEGIMPGGVEALANLGIRPAGVPFVGIRYADAVDPSLEAVGSFPRGFGLGVRRTVLHGAMKDRAKALDVRFHDERVASFEQRGSNVVVNRNLHTRWLIAADGLYSPIRRTLGVTRPAPTDARFGMRRHYSVRPWSDRVEVYFCNGVEAYVTPVDANLVGIAFLFAPHVHAAHAERRASPSGQRFDELLARFPLLRARLADAPVASRLRGAGPFEQRTTRRVVGNVLLVGDAAGYLDPLTGEGIALGLATANAAVTSLLEGRPAAYEKRYQQLTRRYVALTSLLLGLTRRHRQRSVLRLAHALPRAFDEVLGMIGRLPSGAPRA